MIDIKLNKLFIDKNTGKDIYIISMQINESYHNIPVTKEQFDELFLRFRSIYDNQKID
jgi:hypothetical protein